MSVRKSLFAVCLAAMLLGSMLVPLTSSAQGIDPAPTIPVTPIPLPFFRPDLVVASAQVKIEIIDPLLPGLIPPPPLQRVLYLTVKNRGPVAAGASTTRVTLTHPGKVPFVRNFATAPLAPGATRTFLLFLPATYHPGSYRIVVDANNTVYEGFLGGETNNVRLGGF